MAPPREPTVCGLWGESPICYGTTSLRRDNKPPHGVGVTRGFLMYVSHSLSPCPKNPEHQRSDHRRWFGNPNDEGHQPKGCIFQPLTTALWPSPHSDSRRGWPNPQCGLSCPSPTPLQCQASGPQSTPGTRWFTRTSMPWAPPSCKAFKDGIVPTHHSSQHCSAWILHF